MSTAPASEARARPDVLVVGGAAAGLTAAIAARRAGASVRLVESAPQGLRGGNTRHARNFRIMHEAPAWYVPDVYREDEFVADLARVTEGETDDRLGRQIVQSSAEIARWLIEHGVPLQPLDRGVLPYSRRTAFLLGGGKAMVNALYRAATALGVEVSYDSELVGLSPGVWTEVEIARADTTERFAVKAVVMASGGHQSDLAWLQASFGDMAERLVVRGTPYATGRGLKLLLDAGGKPVGDPGRGHIVAVDARGPRFDGGIVTRITAIPYGLVVDRTGRRLADERADTRRTHYAQWGPRIAAAPGQIAYLILDQEGLRRATPTVLPPEAAPTLADLAARLEVEPAALEATVEAFNAEAVTRQPGSLPLRVPPFAAWPMLPGLTFTHFGVAVDEAMAVLRPDGRRVVGVFAAGSIMAANVLGRGYLAGLGVTLAAVTGRRAGEEAARRALH